MKPKQRRLAEMYGNPKAVKLDAVFWWNLGVSLLDLPGVVCI